MTKTLLRVMVALLAIGCSRPSTAVGRTAALDQSLKIVPVDYGIYQGIYPDLSELEVSNEINFKVTDLQTKLNKQLAFVMYQNDWANGPYFPWDAMDQMAKLNKVPYIRIMPRSNRVMDSGSDPVYNLVGILAGQQDGVLHEWARNARASATPMMVEWAPEPNGSWYPWNGAWNGGPNGGPQLYRDVYKHVIDIFRQEGATNVTWAFHVNAQALPAEPWNTMAAYYPGDDYIDWIGVSVFGAQYPWDNYDSFTNVLDAAYPELAAISATKPLSIPEFGVIEDPNDVNGKGKWITEALASLLDGRYPRIKLVSYWSESSWIASGNNDLRVDSSLGALQAYIHGISDQTYLSEMDITWPKP